MTGSLFDKKRRLINLCIYVPATAQAAPISYFPWSSSIIASWKVMCTQKGFVKPRSDLACAISPSESNWSYVRTLACKICHFWRFDPFKFSDCMPDWRVGNEAVHAWIQGQEYKPWHSVYIHTVQTLITNPSSRTEEIIRVPVKESYRTTAGAGHPSTKLK